MEHNSFKQVVLICSGIILIITSTSFYYRNIIKLFANFNLIISSTINEENEMK